MQDLLDSLFGLCAQAGLSIAFGIAQVGLKQFRWQRLLAVHLGSTFAPNFRCSIIERLKVIRCQNPGGLNRGIYLGICKCMAQSEIFSAVYVHYLRQEAQFTLNKPNLNQQSPGGLRQSASQGLSGWFSIYAIRPVIRWLLSPTCIVHTLVDDMPRHGRVLDNHPSHQSIKKGYQHAITLSPGQLLQVPNLKTTANLSQVVYYFIHAGEKKNCHTTLQKQAPDWDHLQCASRRWYQSDSEALQTWHPSSFAPTSSSLEKLKQPLDWPIMSPSNFLWILRTVHLG